MSLRFALGYVQVGLSARQLRVAKDHLQSFTIIAKERDHGAKKIIADHLRSLQKTDRAAKRSLPIIYDHCKKPKYRAAKKSVQSVRSEVQ